MKLAKFQSILSIGILLCLFVGCTSNTSKHLSASSKQTSALSDVEQSRSSIYENNKNAVVLIRNIRKDTQGSGLVCNSSGMIITNYHVIHDGFNLEVLTDEGKKRYRDVLILAVDVDRDLALLQINAEGLRSVRLARLNRTEDRGYDAVQIGMDVLAFGNPMTLPNSLTRGIIAGIRRSEDISQADIHEGYELFQIDAQTATGSSGGALLNMKGEVIAITALGLQQGFNFAIPVNYVNSLIQTLGNSPGIRCQKYNFPDVSEDPYYRQGYLQGFKVRRRDIRYPKPTDAEAKESLEWMARGDAMLTSGRLPKEASDKYKLLFSVAAEAHAELKSGAVPEDLRRSFTENRISLSDKAYLSVRQADVEWLIIDGNMMYTVEKEEEKLRICEFRDAVEAYLTAIEINPWNIDVRNNLGLFYITYVGSLGIPFEEHREYLEKGMDCFREAHRLDPKHEHAKGNLAEGYMSLAVLYHQRRNREVARDYATKCLEIDNQRSVTYCLRAIQNRELGHWEQAVKDCKKAIEIDPKYAEAYVELAATYQKTGRRIEAAEMLKKAAELGHPEAKKSLSENSKPIPDSKKSKEFYCVIVAHTESQANNDVIKNVTTLLKKKGYTPFNYSVPENEDYRKSPLYKQLKLDINKELDDSHKDLHKKLLADIISEALPSKIPTEEEMSADAIKMIKQQEQVSNKRHGRNDVFHPIAILYLFGMQ